MRLAQYIKKGIVETLRAGRRVYYNPQRGVLVHITPIPDMRWEWGPGDVDQLYRGTIDNNLNGTRKNFEIWLKI